MAGGNFLVFGLGYDSPFWMASNSFYGGHTTFLEDHADWVVFQPPYVINATTVVKYSSSMATALHDINDTSMLDEFYSTQVPSSVKNRNWDVILVDGPEGWDITKNQPGRGQSIYAASKLASAKTTIFVDDCNRDVEMAYLQRWLLVDGRTLKRHTSGHAGPGTNQQWGSTCEITHVPAV
jgi:hypothetical protein